MPGSMKVCVKCDLHGHTVPFAGHSSRCRYKRCKCKGCQDHDKSLAIQRRERRIRNLVRRGRITDTEKINKPGVTLKNTKKAHLGEKKKRLDRQFCRNASKPTQDIICLSTDSDDSDVLYDIDRRKGDNSRQSNNSSSPTGKLSRRAIYQRKFRPGKFFSRKPRENCLILNDQASSSSNDDLPDPEDFHNVTQDLDLIESPVDLMNAGQSRNDQVINTGKSDDDVTRTGHTSLKLNLRMSYPHKIIEDVPINITTPPRNENSQGEVSTPSTIPWSPSKSSPFSSPFSGQMSGNDTSNSLDCNLSNGSLLKNGVIYDSSDSGNLSNGVKYSGVQFEKNGLINDSSDDEAYVGAMLNSSKEIIDDSSDEEAYVGALLNRSVEIIDEYLEEEDSLVNDGDISTTSGTRTEELRNNNNDKLDGVKDFQVMKECPMESSNLNEENGKSLEVNFITVNKEVQGDDISVTLDTMVEELNNNDAEMLVGARSKNEKTKDIEDEIVQEGPEINSTQHFNEQPDYIELVNNDCVKDSVSENEVKVLEENSTNESLSNSVELDKSQFLKTGTVRRRVLPPDAHVAHTPIVHPPNYRVAHLPIPEFLKGWVIGRYGHFIEKIKWETGTLIYLGPIFCEVKGSNEGVEKAIRMIEDRIKNLNIWHAPYFLNYSW